MCGYDQIVLAGGAPAIGESRVLCQERSGEWKGPSTCRGEGESTNPEIAGYRCLSSVGTSENEEDPGCENRPNSEGESSRHTVF